MKSYNNIRRYNAAIMGANRKKVKNILYMARDWNLDGAEKQLLYLVTGLNREAYTPIVLLDRPGALNASLRKANVQTHILKLHSWRSFPEGMLRYLDAMRATLLARKLRIDLVHTSDFWQTPYANFIAARLGVPNVIHVRGPLSSRDIAKHGISRATALITIARRYCDDLAAAGIPSEQMTLIDDAVDADLFFPLAKENDLVHLFREKFGVHSRLAVGMAGRIDRFKRVIEFLELIAALPPGVRAKAHFLIVGEQCDSNRRAPDDYLQVIQNKLEQLGLKQNVIFTGRSDDMPVVLNALDILVTMSGGSVMFEAMACAKPVLSVRTDNRHSLHTLHNQTAWCVTTDNADRAAQGLAELIENQELRRRLGEAGRSWVQENLSHQLLIKRTEALYEKLLGSAL